MTTKIFSETVERKIFIANDGKEFSTEYQCKAHEEKLTAEIRQAKRNRLFKNPIEDSVTSWVNGYGRWWEITLNNYDDLVDFLEIISDAFDASYFDTSFVNEVTSVLDNGSPFEMLVYEGDCYLTRYDRVCTTEDFYNETLAEYDDAERLIAAMRRNTKFVSKEKKTV